MVPAHFHVPFRQRMTGKPIRVGYKVWTLATHDGYPMHMDVYQGKGSVQESREMAGLGQGASVIWSMTQKLEKPQENGFFFDNYSSSVKLFEKLSEHKIKAIATIRENRIKTVEMPAKETLKKVERGFFDVGYNSEVNVAIISWKDSKKVNFITNDMNDGPTLPTSTRRYSTKSHKLIQIPMPRIANTYNVYMGGVDIFNRHLKSYRPAITQRKWYSPLFVHCINSLVAASYILCTKYLGNKMDHLVFRKAVVNHLVKLEEPPINDLREEDVYSGHVLGPATKQRRCKRCQKNARQECVRCKVNLHRDCFSAYHQRVST